MSKIVMGTLLLFALAVLALSFLVANRRQSGYINQLNSQQLSPVVEVSKPQN